MTEEVISQASRVVLPIRWLRRQLRRRVNRDGFQLGMLADQHHVACMSEPSPEPASPPSSSSQLSKRFLKELSCLSHVLFNIRLQMPRSCLPIIRRIADPPGKEDELV